MRAPRSAGTCDSLEVRDPSGWKPPSMRQPRSARGLLLIADPLPPACSSRTRLRAEEPAGDLRDAASRRRRRPHVLRAEHVAMARRPLRTSGSHSRAQKPGECRSSSRPKSTWSSNLDRARARRHHPNSSCRQLNDEEEDQRALRQARHSAAISKGGNGIGRRTEPASRPSRCPARWTTRLRRSGNRQVEARERLSPGQASSGRPVAHQQRLRGLCSGLARDLPGVREDLRAVMTGYPSSAGVPRADSKGVPSGRMSRTFINALSVLSRKSSRGTAVADVARRPEAHAGYRRSRKRPRSGGRDGGSRQGWLDEIEAQHGLGHVEGQEARGSRGRLPP